MWSSQMCIRDSYEAQVFSMRRYVVLLDHSYYISGYVPAARLEEVEQTLKMCIRDSALPAFGAPCILFWNLPSSAC